MYKIVIFSDENSCEGVPSSWVVKVGDETHCLWPKTTIANLNKMIKNGEMPSKSWSSVKCRVKSEARDFKEMIEKRKEAENYTTTDINSSSSNNDSSSDESLLLPTPPKRMKTSNSEYIFCS